MSGSLTLTGVRKREWFQSYLSSPISLTTYLTLGSTTTIHRSGVIIIIGHDPRSGITRATTSAQLGVAKFRTALVWVVRGCVVLILTARWCTHMVRCHWSYTLFKTQKIGRQVTVIIGVGSNADRCAVNFYVELCVDKANQKRRFFLNKVWEWEIDRLCSK